MDRRFSLHGEKLKTKLNNRSLSCSQFYDTSRCASFNLNSQPEAYVVETLQN